MISGKFQTVIQSIRFYRKQVFYQVMIVTLLAAVITGSLLTGNSVRESLKKTAGEHLGNTGILVSSGGRYFDAELAGRLKDSAGIRCTGLLELSGYCQALNSQKEAFNTHIYGVSGNFFRFNGIEPIVINPGEAAINQRLAEYLSLKQGDNLIVRFKKISDIPADAPFAATGEGPGSVVLRIVKILPENSIGNFSLSISQIMPMNIFITPEDLVSGQAKKGRINRLLIERNGNYSVGGITATFKKELHPEDIGLSMRMIKRTGQAELISDRIFIDAATVKEIRELLPSSAPLITYLGNRFRADSHSTPYSFISALPSSLYPGIPAGNGIVINRWMADDLGVTKGDSIKMYWYSPDSLNKLIEMHSSFIIGRIADMQGIWSDSLLMPAFPGISGRESCSEWDAGVPIKMNQIRPKDEDYWNKFRGTPKAFISYEKGKEIWGNNYGPATALRFPDGMTIAVIRNKLRGALDPQLSGFTFADIYTDSIKAADEGVDFGTLFLSLGFFLILASVVLLSFAVSSYFDSKKEQVNILFALGFRNRWIENLLFLETSIISLTGCLTGALAGYLVNVMITGALNSVWQGAVQTDTMSAFFTIVPVATGFLLTMVTTFIFLFIKVHRFLRSLNRKEKELHKLPSSSRNLVLLIVSGIITISLFILSILYEKTEMAFGFTSGVALLFTLIIAWRQYFISPVPLKSSSHYAGINPSKLYYLFNPSHGVTPVLFIAAGLFAVFITGANRMNITEKNLTRSSGNGGYLLWVENSIPVKEDMNSTLGRKTLGLDIDSLSGMTFIQMKRSAGNDASCLNLNHIVAPPLLGLDPVDFIKEDAFSFSAVMDKKKFTDPWQYLNQPVSNNTLYGIADQTVLEWGLKVKTGDTLSLRAENGQHIYIIVAAGLNSSVFQGYVLIGKENFSRFFPSVSGNSVFLVDGRPALSGTYKRILSERLDNYGPYIEKTTERLSDFNRVTNTYLSVFGAFGALGMITAIAGLGFVLLRNYNRRKREFGLLMATGFSIKKIRRMILSEQLLILFAGISAGVVSAIAATLSSIKGNHNIPWLYLGIMILAIAITGLAALFISVQTISDTTLTSSLKKE